MLFGRILRGLGIDVNPGRMIDLVDALQRIEIKQRLDWLSCGILSVDNLNKCIDEHMNFEYDHPKLLRQLLTHDAWMRVVDSL